MLFHADIGGRQKSVGDGEKPRLPIAMPAPIDGNGFQTEIDGGEMGTGGDAGLAQDRRGQQPAKPWRVLQDGKLVPGIEGDDRLQHRRQVFRLTQHAPPFFQPGILVPVEVVDHRIFLLAAATAGPCCILNCRLRSGQNRVDGGIVDARKVFDVVDIVPLPFPIVRDGAPDGNERLHLFRVGRRNLCGFSESADAVCRQCPAGKLGGDPPAGAQHVAGDGEFVGWGAGIAKGVVKDEVFEMDELAVDPEGGAGVAEILPIEEARSHRRAGDPLVETGERDTASKAGRIRAVMLIFVRS